MGLEDIKPGKYKAVAIGGKFGSSSKKGTPGVGIEFQFETEEGTFETMRTTLWLSPAALERTMTTLVRIGYDESKGHLPDGTIPREYFNPKAEVEIDIQETEEQFLDRQGMPRTAIKKEIKWINALGGGGFNVTETADVKGMLASIGGLKAGMQAARKELGLDKPKPSATKAATPKATATKAKAELVDSVPSDARDAEPSLDTEEDIPF